MRRRTGQRSHRAPPRFSCTEDRLREALAPLSPPTDDTLSKLSRWTVELERWSRTQRLVGWRGAEGLVAEGLVDAWAMLPLLDKAGEGPLVDLGSGAGLPGLVLAAARPDHPVHLVESRRKRAAFLRAAADAMGLERVTVHHGRAEALCGQVRLSSQPTLCARAFAAPADVLEAARAWDALCCIVTVGEGSLPSNPPVPWALVESVPGFPGPHRRHALFERG